MRWIQIFVLSFTCLTNIAWMWKEDPQVERYMQLGYEAWQSGNTNEAMNYYEDALTLNPKEIDAINTLGAIYEELGLTDKAEEKYLSAIKLDYKFLPAYSNLGLLYWNQGNSEKAVYYFQKRVSLGNPKDFWTIKAKKALEAIKSGKGRESEVDQALNQLSQ